MSRPVRARALVRAVASLACVALAAPGSASAEDNPLAGKRQFLDCSPGHIGGAAPYTIWPDLWQALRERNARKIELFEQIAHVPQAKWLAGANVRRSPGRVVGDLVANVRSTEWGGPTCQTHYDRGEGAADPYVGDYPILAIRQLDHLDCSRTYDGGGTWNRLGGAYEQWIEAVVRALAPIGHQATVILEPDGLPVIPNCLSPQAGKQRLALMRSVARRLGNVEGLTTYIDIGSSSWLKRPLAARLLRRAGVRHVRGFALNTTHFNYTRKELRYGDALARRLGKHYVVNTAENGRGALKVTDPKRIKDRFCNPKNAGLGALPTTRTASRHADAYLWISRPGLSSNGHSGMSQCSRGPGGNVFWEPKAIAEASRKVFQAAPWPAAPL